MGIIVDDADHLVLGHLAALQVPQHHGPCAACADEHGSGLSVVIDPPVENRPHDPVGKTGADGQHRQKQDIQKREALGHIPFQQAQAEILRNAADRHHAADPQRFLHADVLPEAVIDAGHGKAYDHHRRIVRRKVHHRLQKAALPQAFHGKLQPYKQRQELRQIDQQNIQQNEQNDPHALCFIDAPSFFHTPSLLLTYRTRPPFILSSEFRQSIFRYYTIDCYRFLLFFGLRISGLKSHSLP